MASTSVLKSPDPTAPGSQLNLPPRIISNRRQIDDRFPVLGFTILSDRPGYYEVLLATQPTQLNVTGARTPSTSYSSRSQSGLIPMPQNTSVYLVPAAVLRNFVRGQPRPEKIYYTVVLYSDAAGTKGVFAQPPETLATSAPSVEISKHFGSDGFGDVLGMNPDRLRRVTTAAAQGFASAQAKTSPEEDRAEGEDGTSAPPPELQTPARSTPMAADIGYGDGYSGEPRVDDGDSRAQYATASGDPGYNDGYEGDSAPSSGLGFVSSQQSSFRPGATEPAVLEDDADDDRDSYGQYRSAQGRDDRGDGSSFRAASSSVATQSFRDDDADDDDYRSQTRMSNNGGGSSERLYAMQGQDGADCQVPATATGYGDEAEPWNESAPNYQSLDAPAGTVQPAAPALSLTIEAKRDLIGKLGEYSAVRADAEYNGVYGPEHPAYRRYHLGLSFGIALFNQERGDLNKLLTGCRERDAGKFDQIFGQNTKALFDVLRAQGPPSTDSRDGRSARLQPVDGADLWQEPWISRFREAGCHKPFQAVQNRLAAELYLDPILRFAGWMGFNTERALGIAMDRAAELGVGPAQEWIANAVGPFQGGPQRHAALAALGYPSIRAFQSDHPGTDTNGQWGPLTHAAAVAALRARGNSPVPLPTLEQMLDTLVRRAAHTSSFERVRALRHDARFGDTLFQLGQENRQ
jgi:hypothetical protein